MHARQKTVRPQCINGARIQNQATRSASVEPSPKARPVLTTISQIPPRSGRGCRRRLLACLDNCVRRGSFCALASPSSSLKQRESSDRGAKVRKLDFGGFFLATDTSSLFLGHRDSTATSEATFRLDSSPGDSARLWTDSPRLMDLFPRRERDPDCALSPRLPSRRTRSSLLRI